MGFKPDSAPAPATGRFVADQPTAQPDSGNRSMLQRVIGYGANVVHALRGDDVKPDAMSVGPGTIPAAVGENLLTMGTSIAAPVIAAGKWAKNAITGEPTDVPAEISAHTYEPKTGGGQYLEHLMAAGMKPLMDALELSGKGYGEIAGLAGADSATKENVAALATSLPMTVLGAEGAARAVPNVRAEAARMAARPSPPGPGGGGVPEHLAAVRASGYPVMPSQAAAIAQRSAPRLSMPSMPGEMLETLTNRGETRGRFSIEAAKNTETILRNEFGIPPDVPLTTQTFADLMSRANAAYDVIPQALPVVDYAPMRQALDQLGEMRRVNPNLDSTPGVEALRERLVSIQNAPTQQVLDAVREFRSDARRYFQSQSDPVVNEQIARAYRQAADTLEGGIAEQLRARGEGALYDQFQQARQFQAKLHNVLDSWNGYEIDPQALARIGQDTNLTGGLAEIQRGAQHLPDTVRVTTGEPVGRPTNAGTIMEPESALRRALFDRFVIPRLLSDAFQGKYGTIAGRSPALPYATVGPLGNPDVGPRQPPPPSGGRFPRNLAGEGPPDLAPEGGGVPFESSPIPPQTGAADALGGIFDTNLFRGADTSAADAFPYDLARAVDESPPPSAMPGYGHPELPVDPYAINPDQLRPNVPVGGALQPGASPTGMAVIPEGPMDIAPPPPPDQPPLRGPDRPRYFNPNRRNRPRAGGRSTDGNDLNLMPDPAESGEFPKVGEEAAEPPGLAEAMESEPPTGLATQPRLRQVMQPDSLSASDEAMFDQALEALTRIETERNSTAAKTAREKGEAGPRAVGEERGEPAGMGEAAEGEPPELTMGMDPGRTPYAAEPKNTPTMEDAAALENMDPTRFERAAGMRPPELTMEDTPARTPFAEAPRDPKVLRPASEIKLTGRPMEFKQTYRGYHPTKGAQDGPFSTTTESAARRYDPTGAGTMTRGSQAFKNAIGGEDISMEEIADQLGVEPDGYLIGARAKELGFDGVAYHDKYGDVEIIDTAKINGTPFDKK